MIIILFSKSHITPKGRTAWNEAVNLSQITLFGCGQVFMGRKPHSGFWLVHLLALQTPQLCIKKTKCLQVYLHVYLQFTGNSPIYHPSYWSQQELAIPIFQMKKRGSEKVSDLLKYMVEPEIECEDFGFRLLGNLTYSSNCFDLSWGLWCLGLLVLQQEGRGQLILSNI